MIITIENKYNSTIAARINSDGVSSEDWTQLDYKEIEKWVLKEGQYQLQLGLDTEDNSIPTVYDVFPGTSYFIDTDAMLKYSEGGDMVQPSGFGWNSKFSQEVNSLSSNFISITSSNVVQVTNDGEKMLYIRVSGEDENFVELATGAKYSWIRKPDSSFHMEYALMPEPNYGPTVVVRSGEAYVIDAKLDVKTSSGNCVYPAMGFFRSIAEEEEHVKKIESEAVDKVGKPHIVCGSNSGALSITISDVKINIVNYTTSEIRIRIKNSGQSGSEEFYAIPCHNFDAWTRSEGTYLMEVMMSGTRVRFYVSTGTVYVFSSNLTLKDHMTGQNVQKTTDEFDGSKPKPTPTPSPNPSPGTNVPNRPKKIGIKNSTSDMVYVRIKAKNKGSEDLFPMKAGEQNFWSRELGTFLIELVKNKQTKYKCYVQCQYNYEINDDFVLVNEDTDTVVPESSDNLFPPSWIDQQDDGNNDDDNNNAGGESDNIPVDNSNYPYFKGKKPQLGSGKFTDNDFYPSNEIINKTNYNPHFSHCENEHIDTSGISWKRATEVLGTVQLFKDKIEYNDVNQGQIGDCYLISTIASICRNPHLIQSIFRSKSADPRGFYEVYYYEGGKKYIMFVDDYFPYRSSYGKFYFAQPNGAEIWVLIIEKVLAKYEGGYCNIVGGICSQTLEFLTGCITKDYRNLSDSNTWNSILSAINRGDVICCGSPSDGISDKNCSARGIHYGHAYSILDAKEYKSGGRTLKLLQVRNPWGKGEWKGDYSDSSHLWTPELKKLCNYDQSSKEDGRFWMTIQDFAQEFEDLTICSCGGKKN